MKTRKWTPQFKDGSGWDLKSVKNAPYFYEHLPKEQIFKIAFLEVHDKATHPHKNTYFVKGRDLLEFFNMRTTEFLLSIEEVDKIPSSKKKL